MTKSIFRVVLVEDETPDVLKRLLEASVFKDKIEVVGVGQYRDDSIKIIRETRPDIVFMDLMLGNDREGGFKVLDALKPYGFKVIFSTAFEGYALRAFNYFAQHYVLKPYSLDDIEEALRRCMDEEAPPQVPSFTNEIDYMMLKGAKNQFEKVLLSDIALFEAEGKYCKVYVDDKTGKYSKKIFLGNSLGSYCEPEPPNAFFVRCHKSFMVNLHHVKSWAHHGDEAFLTMSNDVLARVSRAHKSRVLGLIRPE